MTVKSAPKCSVYISLVYYQVQNTPIFPSVGPFGMRDIT